MDTEDPDLNQPVDPGLAALPMEDTAPPSADGSVRGPSKLAINTLKAGHILEGRFRILSLLGKGAMGVVYLAEDRVLGGPPVVLKLMTARGAAAAADQELFRREVLSARSLHHPNVVRVFDYHLMAGVPAITMEYLPGGTLDDLRKQEPTVARWLYLLSEVAEALQAVHANGIIHRDLKPQNILLGEDGRPRVTDFGIATKATDEDESFMGYTPMYAAPEQIRREALGTKTDIYAFGAMAFHVLCSEPPFPKHAMLEGHLKHEPPPLIKLCPTLPLEIDRLVRRCMDKDPTKRPDAATVARQLREAAVAMEPSREAAVLRIDLVAYPSWFTQQQEGAIQRFTEIVAECPDIKNALRTDLLKLSLQDGLVLVFFKGAATAYRTAVQIAQELTTQDLAARMGLHVGSVKMVTDLNAQASAVGGGVTMCERVVSCGSSGHILLSDRFHTSLLNEMPEAAADLQGPFQVYDRLGGKHMLYNLRGGGLGMEFTPGEAPRKTLPRWGVLAGAGALVVAALGFVVLANPSAQGEAAKMPPPPVVVAPVPAPAPAPAPAVAAQPPASTPVAAQPAAAPVQPAPVQPAGAAQPQPVQRRPRHEARRTRRGRTPGPEPTRDEEPPAAAAPVAAEPEPVAVVKEPLAPKKVEEKPAPKVDKGALAQTALDEASQKLRVGDYAGAAARATEALKLDGSLSASHKVLGMAYGRLRRYCDSKQHYEKYLKLNPTADNAPGVKRALQAKYYADCP